MRMEKGYAAMGWRVRWVGGEWCFSRGARYVCEMRNKSGKYERKWGAEYFWGCWLKWVRERGRRKKWHDGMASHDVFFLSLASTYHVVYRHSSKNTAFHILHVGNARIACAVQPYEWLIVRKQAIFQKILLVMWSQNPPSFKRNLSKMPDPSAGEVTNN